MLLSYGGTATAACRPDAAVDQRRWSPEHILRSAALVPLIRLPEAGFLRGTRTRCRWRLHRAVRAGAGGGMGRAKGRASGQLFFQKYVQ